MLITTQTPEQLEARNAQNREMLALNTELYIRKSFNASLISLEAESWIAIAKEQGFNDLATELENDLRFELETA